MSEQGAIIIPYVDLRRFTEATRTEIADYVLASFGMDVGEAISDDEAGVAQLSLSDAKVFLNNCNDKSIAILTDIVGRDGRFFLSDIQKLLNRTPDQLRGAWAGLTKRVRTVTKNPEAVLLNWYRSGNDGWRGVMGSQTVSSMRVALAERN